MATKDSKACRLMMLRETWVKRGSSNLYLSFPKLVVRGWHKLHLKTGSLDILKEGYARIIRPLGRNLHKVVLRMKTPYPLKKLGPYLVNSLKAIEHPCRQIQYYAFPEDKGLTLSRTAVTETHEETFFHELGGGVVEKHVFSSQRTA